MNKALYYIACAMLTIVIVAVLVGACVVITSMLGVPDARWF